jgi:hypothetical protein
MGVGVGAGGGASTFFDLHPVMGRPKPKINAIDKITMEVLFFMVCLGSLF